MLCEAAQSMHALSALCACEIRSITRHATRSPAGYAPTGQASKRKSLGKSASAGGGQRKQSRDKRKARTRKQGESQKRSRGKRGNTRRDSTGSARSARGQQGPPPQAAGDQPPSRAQNSKHATVTAQDPLGRRAEAGTHTRAAAKHTLGEGSTGLDEGRPPAPGRRRRGGVPAAQAGGTGAGRVAMEGAGSRLGRADAEAGFGATRGATGWAAPPGGGGAPGPPGVGSPPGVVAHSQALPTVCQPPHPPPDALTAAEPA